MVGLSTSEQSLIQTFCELLCKGSLHIAQQLSVDMPKSIAACLPWLLVTRSIFQMAATLLLFPSAVQDVLQCYRKPSPFCLQSMTFASNHIGILIPTTCIGSTRTANVTLVCTRGKRTGWGLGTRPPQNRYCFLAVKLLGLTSHRSAKYKFGMSVSSSLCGRHVSGSSMSKLDTPTPVCRISALGMVILSGCSAGRCGSQDSPQDCL